MNKIPVEYSMTALAVVFILIMGFCILDLVLGVRMRRMVLCRLAKKPERDEALKILANMEECLAEGTKLMKRTYYAYPHRYQKRLQSTPWSIVELRAYFRELKDIRR